MNVATGKPVSHGPKVCLHLQFSSQTLGQTLKTFENKNCCMAILANNTIMDVNQVIGTGMC